MSLTINLPNFGNAIAASKDTAFDSPIGYVFVRDGHALVCTTLVILAIDLKRYFIDEVGIDDTEREEFETLLEWMEGKNFTKKFWKDLSGLKEISIIDDNTISLASEAYTTNLVYEHRTILQDKYLKALCQASGKDTVPVTVTSFSKKVYDFIDKAVGKIIGSSNLITEFVERGKPVRFTVDEKNYIFGTIQPYSIVDEKQFNFDALDEFCKNNYVD